MFVFPFYRGTLIQKQEELLYDNAKLGGGIEGKFFSHSKFIVSAFVGIRGPIQFNAHAHCMPTVSATLKLLRAMLTANGALSPTEILKIDSWLILGGMIFEPQV